MFTLDSKYWKITQTSSKGKGVFATQEIAPGTVIGDYLGKVIHPQEEDEISQGGLYGMNWRDDVTYLPLPSSIGIHLINHSCAPNCGMFPFQGRMLFFALRKIFVGEELTVSYMIEPAPNSTERPYFCLCGEPVCRGTMYINPTQANLFWNVFVKQKQGKHYTQKPSYGHQLSRLPAYPRRIKDYPIYDLFSSSNKPPVEHISKLFPSVAEIRHFIRASGRSLRLTHRELTILGILYPDLIISKSS